MIKTRWKILPRNQCEGRNSVLGHDTPLQLSLSMLHGGFLCREREVGYLLEERGNHHFEQTLIRKLKIMHTVG